MIYVGYKFTSHRFLEQWETGEAQIVRRTIGKTTVGRKEYTFTALQTLLRFSHSPCESSFHVLTVKEISVCFQIPIKQCNITNAYWPSCWKQSRTSHLKNKI